MTARFLSVGPSWITILLSSLILLATFPTTFAGSAYVTYTEDNGEKVQLADNRYPALYTQDFGDCLGGESLLNVTLFDAAYYKDNMTVLFHLDGTTNLKNETIMRRFKAILLWNI